MKTFLYSLSLLGILAVLGGHRAHGADAPQPLRKGKVLILRNEYTMEGDIERVGDRYCVRRQVGETWVPAERVLALTASLEDAHAYLHKTINLDDADERLRLARWCRSNGLPKQALAELEAAARLRPNHAETRRLLQYWKQAAARAETQAQSNATRASSTMAPGSDAKHPSGADKMPPIEVTSESLGLFVTRVQPILMNTCSCCHATGRGGNFHLTQVFEDNISNRQTLERNLAAVLTEINVDRPEASLLLIKAVSDHAHTGQAPLRNRQAAPFRALENWVKLIVANNPHIKERNQTASPSPLTPALANEPVWSGEPGPKSQDESQWGADARPHGPSQPSPVARGENAPTVPDGKAIPTKTEEGKPVSTNPTADPYDPEPFNRKTHPEASQSEPRK